MSETFEAEKSKSRRKVGHIPSLLIQTELLLNLTDRGRDGELICDMRLTAGGGDGILKDSQYQVQINIPMPPKHPALPRRETRLHTIPSAKGVADGV